MNTIYLEGRLVKEPDIIGLKVAFVLLTSKLLKMYMQVRMKRANPNMNLFSTNA